MLLILALLAASPWLWRWYRARQEWEQGQSALGGYDLAAAATHLDNYLQLRPEDADGWFLAARTARRLQRIPEAERYLEQCQQLRGVTDATRLEWDLLRVQQGEITGIDTRLRQTIGPDHPDALIVLEALARGYTRVERLADARQACDLWIAKQPEHPWPWLWRGGLYERLSYLDKAYPDYQRAVQNAPTNREARLALGGLLLRQRQASAATEHFEAVLRQSPDDIPAQIGLAACWIEQGKAGQAIPVLDHLLELAPASAQALFLRGKAALEQDQPAQAEHWLREAVRLAPDDPEALYQLSQAVRAQQREAEAAQLTRQLEQLRKDQLRLDELLRAIARKADDPKPRHEAGVIALRIGRTEDGLRWLNSLLLLKGDHRETHAVLAEYYLRKGDQERAAYHRQLAETH